MNVDKQLENIVAKYEKYIKDSRCRFKSCNKYIVILTIPIEHSTNELRDTKRHNWAKYRASGVFVKLIFNKMTLEECDECDSLLCFTDGRYCVTNYKKNTIKLT